MILAGDIGGTKTLLGLLPHDRTDKLPLHQKSFPSQQYDRLETIVAEFLQGFLQDYQQEDLQERLKRRRARPLQPALRWQDPCEMAKLKLPTCPG